MFKEGGITKKIALYSTVFSLIVIYVFGLYIYKLFQPKAYTDENGVVKLEGHPSAKMVGGKAFIWFVYITKVEHPNYRLKVYDEYGTLNIDGEYLLDQQQSEIVTADDLHFMSNQDIELKDSRVLKLVKNILDDAAK